MKAFIAWLCAYLVLFTCNPAFAWTFGSGSGTGLPSQAGNNGKFLTTDGSVASWAALAGGGDMLAANNLSDVTNAGTSRTNLGLTIGTNVQAWDADLDTYATITPSANVQTFMAAANYAAMVTLLNLVIGTNTQAWDADLDTYATITPSADVQSLMSAANYAAMRALLDLEAGIDFYDIAGADAAFEPLGVAAADITDITANGASLITAANYAAMRTLLGLAIGVDVQAYDADLTTYAGITPSANVQSLLGAANYAAFRALLNLDTGDNPQFATIEVGHASDTTISRSAAGEIAVEGVEIYDADDTVTHSIVWNAAGITTDQVQCADPAQVQINSGPELYTIICADNDGSTMYGHTVMPDGWNAGTVTFEASYIQTAADTNVLNSDIACACRGAGETVNNTFGSEVAIDDAAVTGSNAIDATTSAAATCNGTCAAGDNLFWKMQLDATGTTTAVATLHFTGVKMEYTSTISD